MNIPFIRHLLTRQRSRGFQAPVDIPKTISTPKSSAAWRNMGSTNKNYVKGGKLRKTQLRAAQAQLRAAQAQQAYYTRHRRLLPWQVGGTLLGGAATTTSILMLIHKLLNPDFISDKAAQVVVGTVDKASEQLGDRVDKAKDKGRDYFGNALHQELAKLPQQTREVVLARLQGVSNVLPDIPNIPRQQAPSQPTEYNSPANVQSSGNAPQVSVQGTGGHLQYAVPQSYKNIYQQARRGNYQPLIPLGYSAVPWVLKQLSTTHR